MKKYPAIYEQSIDLNSYSHKKQYLYIDESNYYSFFNSAWHKEKIKTSDKNITREYLANTKIKIESKEHEKFVRSLIPDPLRSFWDYKDDDYLYLMTEMSTQDRCQEIVIPLPPEELYTSEDVVEEWQPVIGEKALADDDGYGRETTVTVAYFDKKSGIENNILVFNDEATFWVAKEDLKPLSKEDIILEEVITFLEDANGLGAKVTAMGLVEKFNIEMREE